jgi:hypothetical protein
MVGKHRPSSRWRNNRSADAAFSNHDDEPYSLARDARAVPEGQAGVTPQGPRPF